MTAVVVLHAVEDEGPEVWYPCMRDVCEAQGHLTLALLRAVAGGVRVGIPRLGQHPWHFCKAQGRRGTVSTLAHPLKWFAGLLIRRDSELYAHRCTQCEICSME